MKRLHCLALPMLLATFACGSSNDADHHDLGNMTIGTNSFHIEQEGNWAPGTNTNYAIKPNDGTPKPDSVSCWYGTTDTTTTSQGNYDQGDGDFDCTTMTPASPPANGALFVDVTYGTTVTMGSISVAK